MNMKLQDLSLAVCLLAAGGAQAQSVAKDIVLDQVASPLVVSAAPAARSDAMVVSVLLESPDGTLTPRSTEISFRTGDRFRVKVLASREGRIALYNTTPAGVFKPEPVWRGEVRPGQETITPRLFLDGSSGAGTEQLHVVLEPAAAPPTTSWFGRWFDKSTSKDIRLDQQSTAQATYLVTDPGNGLLATVRIVHR
jgi:hypothetical protein